MPMKLLTKTHRQIRASCVRPNTSITPCKKKSPTAGTKPPPTSRIREANATPARKEKAERHNCAVRDLNLPDHPRLRLHHSPDHLPLKNHAPIDQPLTDTAHPPVPLPRFDADDVKPRSRRHRGPEFHLLDPAKSDESFPPAGVMGEKRGQLRRRLDHDDARKQRPTSDVSVYPEFVIPHVLVPNDVPLRHIHVNDGVQMLHGAALGVDLANGVLIVNQAVEVDAGKVKEQLRGHEGMPG